ncbi:MAG TPA: amino acid adenylation domain-containing protein, partial [Longimicrobium sp.]|uniref:non-ribosomal peptide synthetase n=1 Tax=Longimicrobium sp. TaxID=2029185 RepID=UPI002EDB9D29
MTQVPSGPPKAFRLVLPSGDARTEGGGDAGDRRYARDARIHRLFEGEAARAPHAPALSFAGGTLSYDELNRRANRLARRLRARGVGAETRVAVCLERGPELIVALLAVLKAGGAYLPLDPALPAERLAFILDDAGARVVVTRTALLSRLPAYNITALLLDAEAGATAAEADENLEIEGDAAGLAYVMYTSGSTGRPKGVAVPHRGVVRLVRGNPFARVGPGEVFLQLAPASFDASTFEIWGALLNGGRLAVHPAGTPTPGQLGEFVRAQGVTTLWLTAALFHQMVDTHPDALRGVTQLLAGGDVLWPGHVRRALEALPGCTVINGYGPTEGTTFTTTHPVPSPGAVEEPLPLGLPIAHTRVHLVDEGMDEVAEGEAGELLIGGDGVARGYLNRPGLTAEKFVPDPFSAEPGARLYRSGDRARRREDGRLDFLGRLDHQVKIRGFRVEPGEVEAALLAHPAVREAVVAARADDGGDRRLAAWVAAREPAPDAAALRAHLRERLPEYMVPSAFVFVPGFPLLPSGKVNRGALPEPRFGEDGRRPWIEPRTETERRVAEVLAEVLGVERVGAGDDFFDMGGHSLRATQVVTRLREALRVEIPLSAVFDAPTVAALAARIDAAGPAAEELPPIVPLPRDRPLPLSLPQEAIWFFQELAPGMKSYNFQGSIRFRGTLDTEALERALTEIVRRHEIFRTTFPELDGQPVQAIHPPFAVTLPVDDLRGLAAGAERDGEVQRRMAETFGVPFVLSELPLIRWRLLRLADDEWLLLQVEHHFVHDGWSFAVFLRELTTLYTAYLRGEPSPLPELKVQFADFAAWHRRLMEGDRARADLEYWRRTLHGADPVLELPFDRPRPAAMSFRGASMRVRVPPAAARAARAYARENGATLYMVMLAAFEALLHRTTGQEDFCVGGSVANRSWREAEPLIGMVVNTVALRARLGEVRTFRQLVAQVRATAREAYAHKDVHFGQVVEAVRPERSLGHLPIYQVAYNFHDSPYPSLELPGVTLEVVEGLNNGSSKFELNVTTMPRAESRAGAPEDEIESLWEFGLDVFDRATVERLVRLHDRLLQAMLADPDRDFRQIPLLDDAEAAQALAEATGPARALEPVPVHRGFDAAAARTPDAPAVRGADGALTYAQMARRANRLAHRLVALGVRPDQPVAVYLERSAAFLTGALAALKAGAAYLPLDHAVPADRLAWILEDAAVPVVLTSRALLPRVPDTGAAVVCIEELDEAAAAEGAEDDPGIPVGLDHLAYVIYTSGSTGRPKGVMVPHRALANLCAWYQRSMEITPADRATQLAGAGFDASVLEVWPYLSLGGSIHVVDDDTRLSPAAVRDWMLARGITQAVLPTPLAEGMMALEWPADAPLRGVIAGGDVLHPFARPDLPFFVVNGYGPTETAVCCTAGVAEREGEGTTRTPPIGRPVDNLRNYVLDGALRLLPPGVPGELYVAGAGLARGYVGRADLTAERFLPDPYSPGAGARMYRTGDRVRRLADGRLEYLARADFQVKVRGFRIEPGEVEAALLSHPAVREALAMARADGGGEKRLVAYVAAGADEAPQAAELRAHLRALLPEYMVPAAFVVLDAFPLTANGKVDRRAFPAPADAGADGAEYVAPRTPVEELLAGIWCEVLGRERVGAHEGFFELGGHSLRATRVISRVRSAFGVDLPVRALFDAPTVAGLAARVEAARGGEGAAELPPLARAAGEGPWPLSFAQRRLWFLERMEPGSAAYNLPAAYRLAGALDADALERALRELVRRHEGLRSSFGVAAGEPVQAVGAVEGPLPAVDDLRALPAAERPAELARRVAEASWAPFDLRHGPLFRARLFRTGDEEAVLLLATHHVVSDGWSQTVLARELSALYGAFARGEASPLAEPAFRYADYAAWQHGWLRGEVLQTQLAWWKSRLQGAPAVLELPTDRPRPAVASPRGAAEPVALPPELTAALRALARREGATLFMTLLAAWQALLSKYSGQEDVVVGAPVAGRTHPGVEGVVGCFVNTLALRGDLSGDPTFRALLGRVRETLLGAYAHQDLPFEKLVEELAPERSLRHTPLFQATLALQNLESREQRLGEVRMEPLPPVVQATKFDLGLSLQEDEHEVRGLLLYRADLFDAETVRRMIGHLRVLLEAAAATPERRLSELPLLEGAERARVLREWNPPADAFPVFTLHGRFQARAAEAPDRIAVSFDGESLSYGELNARANRLARHLRRHGVGPESRVGLCMERGTGMLAGILGILKAGGAYVPLDPTYPADRLAYMVEDAGIAVLVTESALLDRIEDDSITRVLLDGDAQAIAAEGDEDLPADVGPEALAYVIYTSGSTGRPKGAMLTHANVARLFTSTDGRFGFGARDVWTLFHSYAFDFSVWEIWGALLYGGRLVVVPFLVSRSPEQFRALLREEGVTVLNQTPSAFQQLIEADAKAPEPLEALRYVVFGGEALHFPSLRPWLDRYGPAHPRLVNMYGITETCVHVTHHAVTGRELRDPGVASVIGGQLADLRLYVL